MKRMSQFLSLPRIIALFAIALGTLMTMAVLPARAHGTIHAAPDVFMYEAYAFRSILEPDDLFIVFRYELPKTTIITGTVDAWCAELADTDGCGAVPAIPTDPTSLLPGSAFGRIYSDGFGGTLVDEIALKRIDHALGGLYIDAGHTILWANASTEVCVESSTSLYSAPTHECAFPTWASAANVQQDQLDALEVLMTGPAGPMVNLESVRLQPDNTYINGVNLISPAGQVFALEVLSFMDRIIPGAFQLGAGNSVVSSIATPTGDSDIQVMIDATAAATGITQDLENVGQQYLGLSGPTTALIGVLIASLAFGGMMWAFTKSPPLMILGLLTPLMWGLWMRGPTFAVIAAMIAVFGTVGAWGLIRKAPQ